MEHFKGTRFIVDAFKEFKKKYPGIQLHVAFGDAKDFMDHEDIYCFQPHGDKELGNFYRSLDYYICAGYTQLGAFHYPVAEAMSCGIPVITTKYYPANETNAWLIGPQNIRDIVFQFEMAGNNSLLKAKKVGQWLIDVKQFEWKLVAKKLNNYLNEFLQRPKFKQKYH
jgi:glycosyltransferase involved in cell wall biosynthesis